MKHRKKKTIKIESFSPLPPLSIDEFEQLKRFAAKHGTRVEGTVVHTNGPHVPFVAVLYGNWRLVEQEMKRMGRDFNESVPYWLGSDEVGPA